MPLQILFVLLVLVAISPINAYVSAMLLAAMENVNKFIFAFTFTGEWLCEHVSIDKKQWPKWLRNSLDFMALYLENTFSLTDIAMYCQLMISLNRFLAVSFDGLYFHIIRRSPLIQLAVPYLMRCGIACLDIYVPLELLSLWTILKGYMIIVPLFLMCGMDVVMSRQLKQLRQNGKASRAESLLMIQMISNSGVTALYFVAQNFVKGTATIFYGLNVQFLVWDILELIRLSFLTFVTR
ncbi:unnamed protein product, partial [Mesorhabditis belari]|uniref:Uncharacterized protein n=1 Tax=Mesorhabditis belari TaxID=2138241 RepID=A0AAF3EGS3_9BILA